jgi:hypothetical protein
LELLSKKIRQAEEPAEKFQICHSEGGVSRGICFFLAIDEKADPSVAAATSG